MPYAIGGNPRCWAPPVYTFQRCCVPESASTAASPFGELVVEAHPLANVALETLRRSSRAGGASGDFEVSDCGVGGEGTVDACAAGESRATVWWRQRWACPPPISERGRDGESLEPGGVKGACAHPQFEDGLWSVVHELAHLSVSFAQSVPGDAALAALLAAAIRLAHAVRELWCTLRWWQCFPGGDFLRRKALAQVCALIDLAFFQVAGLGGIEGELGQLLWPGGLRSAGEPFGLCGLWQEGSGGGPAQLVSAASGPIYFALEDRLRSLGTARWPSVPGLRAHYGNTLVGQPLVPHQGGPGGSFVHFAMPLEFNPACAGIAQRPEKAPFYSAEGHGLWVDSTGTLTWHLSILDIAEVLLAMTGEDWAIVNVGAEDGGCHSSGQKYWMYDPANCLLEANPRAGAVLLEGNADSLRALRGRVRGRGGRALCVGDYVTPEGAMDALLSATVCDDGDAGVAAEVAAEAERLRRRVAAGDVDLLKVDVDFGDCDFLEALTPSLRPKFVHAEMNPHYPPPFAQRQHFDAEVLAAMSSHPSDLPGAGGPAHWIRGCSLSGIAQAIGGQEQYVLLQVEFDHALFVRADLAPRAAPLWPRMAPLRLWDHWLSGYFCHPLRYMAREDERIAGFDFRMFVPPGYAEGSESAMREAEASMRALLVASGGAENEPRRSSTAAYTKADGGRFPFSLQRCDACG